LVSTRSGCLAGRAKVAAEAAPTGGEGLGPASGTMARPRTRWLGLVRGLLQRGQFLLAEAGGAARLDVERAMQHRARVLGQQLTELRLGLDAAPFAEPAEPAAAGGHVRNLLAQDHLQHAGGRIVA